MNMSKKVLIPVAIFVLALLLRLPGIGGFMTVDEGNWMVRSAHFYDELLAGNPGGTFLTTHPGSTAMWIIGAGETITLQPFYYLATFLLTVKMFTWASSPMNSSITVKLSL